MNPTARKMFKSRDARNALRGMGGILASSPELAQTVQQFQEGGPVDFNDWQQMSRTDRKSAGLPTSDIGGQLFFDRFQLGTFGGNPDQLYTADGPFGVDEDILMSQPVVSGDPSRLSSDRLMRTTQPVTVDYMGNLQTFYTDMETGKIYDASGQDLNRLMSPAEYTSVQSKVNQSLGREDQQAAEALDAESQAAQEAFETNPSAETLALAAEARKTAADRTSVPVVSRNAVERVLSRPSGSFTSRDVFSEEGPGATQMDSTPATQMDSTTGTALDFDRTTDLPPRQLTTPPPADNADADADADADAGTGTVDLKKLGPLMPNANDTDDDIRAKYKDRLALLQEVLGENEAGARNKGMDLAMIGLAIMSGQSPNALTNIAQGGAAGLQAMSARDEAARERQRLIKTSALEGVLDEEAAGTAAAATAAEKALDRQNRLDAAKIANSTDLDTKTGEVTYRSLFQEAYKVATDLVNMPPEVRSGEMTAVEYATKIAKAGLAGSKGQIVPGPTTTIADPAAVDAAIKSRVDAAKNNPATLAAIKQSLITKGMDPSKYGLK